MVVRIQLRHDTSENWNINNPILYIGEVGIEIDTKKMKVGDGNTPYNELEYIVADSLPEITNMGMVLTNDGTQPIWKYIAELNNVSTSIRKSLSNIILNTLTASEYREKFDNGTLNDDELYIITSKTYSKEEIDNMIGVTSHISILDDEKEHILITEGTYDGVPIEDGTIFVKDSGKIVKYIDKIASWTSGDLELAYVEDIAYGNGRFVACTQSQGFVLSSADGFTWQRHNLETRQYGKSVAYGNGKFLIAPWAGGWYESTDGMNWSKYTKFPSTVSITMIRWCNDRFIASTETDKLYYSTDGELWQEIILPMTAAWECPCYGNGVYIVPSYNSGVVALSENCIDWEIISVPLQSAVHMAFGNGVFVSDSGYYSTDGRQWNKIYPEIYISELTFGNGYFVAVNSNQTIYSMNGIDWVVLDNSRRNVIDGIAHGDNKFVMMDHSYSLNKSQYYWLDDNIIDKRIVSISYNSNEVDELIRDVTLAGMEGLSNQNGTLTWNGDSVALDKNVANKYALKSEIDVIQSGINKKADKETTYTKTEVDELIHDVTLEGLEGLNNQNGTLTWNDDSVALDKNVVHTTGNETIADNKKFTGNTTLSTLNVTGNAIIQNLKTNSDAYINGCLKQQILKTPDNSIPIGTYLYTHQAYDETANLRDYHMIRYGSDGFITSTIGLNRICDDGVTADSAITFGVGPNHEMYVVTETPSVSSNDRQIATTAFVKSILSSNGNGLATYSKTYRGYYKFANGLIIQWGDSTPIASDSLHTVTLPTPFTDGGSYHVITQWTISFENCTYITNKTNTKFEWGVSNGTTYSTISWIAIGC